MDSVVVTTLPFVVSVEGEKLQLASGGKPEQLNEMELLVLNPVNGVMESTKEVDCPAPTVALGALEEMAMEEDEEVPTIWVRVPDVLELKFPSIQRVG